MLKRAAVLFLAAVFSVTLFGCATAKKKNMDLELQSLRNQVSVLEAQLQSKDEEISGLRDSLSRAQEADKEIIIKKKKKIIGEVKSRPNNRQIQIALANAGYNPGSIDGKMGANTVEAIKAFQRANNLYVDGKVGKKTWLQLKEFLYKKVK